MVRILSFLLSASVLLSATWPRYRGPNGTGVAEGTDKLPSSLDPANVLWKTPLPKGISSPIVWNDHVFATGADGDNRVVVALGLSTGKELWRRSVTRSRAESSHPLHNAATPTPTTDGQRVYAFFADYGLVAYDFDGKLQWSTPLGPFSSVQGLASSPILADGQVILLIDQTADSFVAAFDAKTGKQAWKTERPSGFLGGYATPALASVKGLRQIIVAGALELTAYQSRTGERIWWAPGVTNGPAASPLVTPDSVVTLDATDDEAPPFSMMLPGNKNKDGKLALDEFPDGGTRRLLAEIDRRFGNNDAVVEQSEWDASFKSVAGRGGLVATALSGKGEIGAPGTRWKVPKTLSYVLTPILYKGTLYVLRDNGVLQAYNPATGERQKEARVTTGRFYASPVAADGKLYFASEDGKLTVMEAGGEWKQLSSTELGEGIYAGPAIAGNRILIRGKESLFCFGL